MIPAKSLLFAAGRIDAPELDRIKEQFEAKFGKEFVDVNSEVGKTTVEPSLVVKLGIRTPDVKLVDRYLAAIAQIFNVNWQPPEAFIDESSSKTAQTPTMDFTTPPPPYTPELAHIAPQSVTPGEDLPSLPPNPPAISTPSVSHSPVPDFEELTRRFQALKENKR